MKWTFINKIKFACRQREIRVYAWIGIVFVIFAFIILIILRSGLSSLFLGVVAGVISAVIVSAIVTYYDKRHELHRKGLDFPEGWKNHIVIMGYNRLVPQLIKTCSAESILIQTKQDIEMVRKQIYSICGAELAGRTKVVYGDKTSEADNVHLMLNDAAAVYVICEEDKLFSESKSLSCLRIINKLVNRTDNPLSIYVEMSTSSSFSLVKQLEMPDDYFKRSGNINLNIVPFNIYETWARRLWGYYGQTAQSPRYYPLDFEDLAPESKHYVHLVIVGFERMGTALLLEALRICHYPNYSEEKNSPKTKITVIDQRVDELLPVFKARYPYIEHIQDIDVEYVHGRLEDDTVRKRLEQLAESAESGKQDSPLLTIALCFKSADTGVSSLLSLPQQCFWNDIETDATGKQHPKDNTNVKILLRQEQNDEFIHFIMKDDVYVPKYNNVRVFGMLDDTFSLLINDKGPQWIKAYYDSIYSTEPNVRLKEDVFTLKEKGMDLSDYLQTRWWAATEDERYSNRYQVEMYHIYQRYEKYDSQPNYPILSQMEHLRWCADRYILGYQRVNDKMKYAFDNYKIHYDLCPFSQLHAQDQRKDRDVIINRNKVIKLLAE